MEKPDSGYFRLGTNVKTGYYDQEHQVLHKEKNLFEEISDSFPELNNTKIRTVLASFLFTGDDIYKLIGDLSGGERGRVSLAKLMLSNANFLLLDEPTNHLDTSAREILEQALNEYEGTVFYVSHDRYFVNTTATRILDLNCGQVTNYIGNYDYYLEKKDELSGLKNGSDNEKDKKAPSESALSWEEQKAEQARIRKKENRIAKIEDMIDANQKRSDELNELMSDPEIATDAARLKEISDELNSLEEETIKLMDEWEELMSS
jgi:ATP-binding cassette subfamily F protein 3